MTLYLMPYEGETKEIKHVAYFSIYPHVETELTRTERYVSGQFIRIEYKDNLYPVQTLSLVGVKNIWCREKVTP